MENSFYEYRDKTGVYSGSDSEFIDTSVIESVTYSTKKKNNTCFVPESEESSNEELSPELVPKQHPQPHKKSISSNESLILRRTKKRILLLDSDTDNSLVIEYDKNKKVACRKDTPLKIESDKKSIEATILSMDSDNESCDGDDDENVDRVHDTGNMRKLKKMVINSDSSDDEMASTDVDETDNRERSRENDSDHLGHKDEAVNGSLEYDDDISSGPTDDDDDGPDEDMMVMSRATRMSIMGLIPKDNDSDESDFIHSNTSERKSECYEINESTQKALGCDDDLPEVSIHKTPKKTFQTQDDLHTVSIHGLSEKSEESDNDGLPEVYIQNTPKKTVESDDELPDVTIQKSHKSIDSDDDNSRLSCSPICSPLHDITNQYKSPRRDSIKESRRKSKILTTTKVSDFMDLTVNSPAVKPKDLSNAGVIDLSHIDHGYAKHNVLDKSASVLNRRKMVLENDDVTIIETKTEVIALSSDEEDVANVVQKPPKSEKSDAKGDRKHLQDTIKQYMVPASYPNQVTYVKKQVRDKEVEKLNGLKEDLRCIRILVTDMNMETLADGGARIMQRLAGLEAEVRHHGDLVANMLVEPDEPNSSDIDKGLSWDDIQKGSHAVQPRMFGKQAMASHMAERHLILEGLRCVHESLASRPAEQAQAPPPRLLASALMPHQLHALVWLQWRETQRPAGGILADDMGLGKTITMISLVASDKENNIDRDDDPPEGTAKQKLTRGGTLVVCPASLLQQWAAEVGKHCTPHALAVCLHHGTTRSAAPHRLAAYDIVVTTYNILQRDNEKNGVLMKIQWRRVILDEAHIVRNHKSATSVAVSNLKGKRRWCLTGTPVQNKDLDLFALIKFLRCSPIDDLQMWKKWIDNKSAGGQERLSTYMRCLLLRRTKVQLQQRGELACLPAREPHLILVTLTTDEMNVYQKVLVLSKTLFGQFLHQRAEKNAGYVGTNSEYDKMHKKMIALQGVKPVKSHEILVLLLRLRQVCCHCGLISGMLDESTAHMPEDSASSDLLSQLDKLSLEDKDRRKSNNSTFDDEAEVENEESAKADEAIRAIMLPNNPVFQMKRPSSKITAVMKCLNENVFTNKGEKAVVVSQWTSVLRLVETELTKLKVRSVTLSGAVSVAARPQLISALNDPKSDVKVMLLSLCAGGVGINLCGANHLLLLDPHWNPQLEEQAQDRIYRVGQNRDVHIYRFMCVDTVEQSIRKLQEAKLQLAENVLTGARNNAASSLSIEDLKMLFNMAN